MYDLRIAGHALTLVLTVARLAAQLRSPANRDVTRTLDAALVAIVAGGAISAILDSP